MEEGAPVTEEPSVPPAETPREKAERLWKAAGYALAAADAAADASAAAYAAADDAAADAYAAADAAAGDADAANANFQRGKARWKKEHP
jgi:hypothetical protein